MNKYTLEFKSKKLEDEYQQQRIRTISIPVFQFGSACIFVVATFKLIQLVLQNNLELIPILIVCQVFSVLSFILLHFKIHKINLQLILLSYLLIAYELIIKTDTSFQALSLYQSNFTMCGVIIILISELKESLIIIISTLTFKIIYALMMESEKSYTIYSSTLILMFFMCFFSYKLNVLNRTSFLLSQYDYMWESIFPKIVDTPYLIFTFSEEKLEFVFKSQSNIPFECNNSQQLKQFLRDWHLNQDSLENTLYKLYLNEDINEFHSKKIQIIKDNKTKQYIHYSIMKSLSSTFIIKFNDSLIKIDDCKIILQKTVKKQEQLRMKLIKGIYKNLHISLNLKQLNNLWSIRNSCLKQIMNFKILKYQWKTQQFDIKKFLYLNDYFLYKHNRLTFFNPKNENIITIVIQLKRLLFEILDMTFHQGQVDIQILETITIQYEGKEINCQKDPVLQLVWSTLVEKAEMQNNFWVIQLYREPCVNFTNQKTSK
ncbi:unnamed protein product [Paramecium pentaurelia]|uniref:Transmembrane protein n=1 Tax=Paramecium pentaurelia TaxID=43138 RepID=A0A8S1TXK4_9CILI|nr:unnamed protein product [Paramecium pentaurelia]